MTDVTETLTLRSCELVCITEESEPEVWDVTWHGLALGRIGRTAESDDTEGKAKEKDKPRGKGKDKDQDKDKAKGKGREKEEDARWWFQAVGDAHETPDSRSIKQALRRLIRNFQRNLANETGV